MSDEAVAQDDFNQRPPSQPSLVRYDGLTLVLSRTKVDTQGDFSVIHLSQAFRPHGFGLTWYQMR